MVNQSSKKPEPQTCSICHEMVDADDTMSSGMPNCVTCKNGHFIHRACYDQMTTRLCPLCREVVNLNCRGPNGYFDLNRKGGKKRKTSRKLTSTKKRRIRTNKRRK